MYFYIYVLVRHCGGLTFASCHMPTQLLSLSIRNRTGGENKIKMLMGRDKGREITYQLLSQAKLT